jgi:heptaprenyl diphosphate synthase
MDSREKKTAFRANAARRVAFLGLLFALAVVLSWLEWMIPALPALPPGVKLGLSNIVTMYTLFFIGDTRGVHGGGAQIAVCPAHTRPCRRRPQPLRRIGLGGAMLLLLAFKRIRPSYLVISVAGAWATTSASCFCRFLVNSAFVMGYLPILILSGIVMGW